MGLPSSLTIGLGRGKLGAISGFPAFEADALPLDPWGRGHDGLVNCVRTGMSKDVSISKTFVAANAIYSHKFAGHNALANAFVASYEDPPAIFSVRNR